MYVSMRVWQPIALNRLKWMDKEEWGGFRKRDRRQEKEREWSEIAHSSTI